MADGTHCPTCGESLGIGAVDATCPDCVGRFERWCAEVTRIVREQAGLGAANPLDQGGEHGPVLLQYAQQWFNEGLDPEQAARREIELLGDLRATSKGPPES